VVAAAVVVAAEEVVVAAAMVVAAAAVVVADVGSVGRCGWLDRRPSSSLKTPILAPFALQAGL